LQRLEAEGLAIAIHQPLGVGDDRRDALPAIVVARWP
jgi:hypothetical protein